jgi:branched-chain amino acid transport system substrate-binding protein
MRNRLFKGRVGILCFGLAVALGGVIALSGMQSAIAQGKAPIKIGFSIAQTGALAALGKSALLARQIWLDDVNARGGILGRPVQLVVYDDQSNPATVAGIYSKLMDVDKVDILYAPYASHVQAPALHMAKQRDRLISGLFSTWANEVLKYERYFQIQPAGPPSDEYPGGFTRLAARSGCKTITLLAADQEGTLYWRDSNRREANRLGLKVVYDQKYPISTVEFSSMLRAINATKPDAVYFASLPVESVAIIRAMEEVGVSDSVKLFGGGLIGLQNAVIMEQIGSKLNGIVNINFFLPEKNLEFTGTRQFFNAYQPKAKEAKLDEWGYYMPPFAYATGQVVEQAVSATKTFDDKVLAKYIHEAEFDTIVGKVRFGPHGEWLKSRVLQSQFRGITGAGLEQFKRPGAQVILDPPELVTGQPIMPFAAARK